MPAVTRELSIVYGSTTIGGASDTLLLDGPIKIESDYTEATVTFSVVVTDDSSEANFKTAVAAFETAFSTPRQDLTITLGAQTLNSFSQSSNTGMDAEPRFSKPGSAKDSGRSRLYVVTITFQLPAGLSGVSGRQSAVERLDVAPSGRRTLAISGVYTALSGNSAVAQYDASIAAYASSVISALGGGGTYELLDEVKEPIDTGKRMRFSRTYLEVIANQSVGTPDNANVKGAVMVVRPRFLAPGDTGNEYERLSSISVSYQASVDSAQTTDLKSLWEGTILPHIAERVSRLSGTAGLALISAEPVYDEDNNTIAATCAFLGQVGGNLLQLRVVETVARGLEDLLVPVYNGDPFARDKYKIPIDKTLTVETTKLTVASARASGGGEAAAPQEQSQGAEGGGEAGGGGDETGWKLLDEDTAGPVEGEAPEGWEFQTALERRESQEIGLRNLGYAFDVLRSTRQALYQRANVLLVIDSTGQGGGNTGGTVEQPGPESGG